MPKCARTVLHAGHRRGRPACVVPATASATASCNAICRDARRGSSAASSALPPFRASSNAGSEEDVGPAPEGLRSPGPASRCAARAAPGRDPRHRSCRGAPRPRCAGVCSKIRWLSFTLAKVPPARARRSRPVALDRPLRIQVRTHLFQAVSETPPQCPPARASTEGCRASCRDDDFSCCQRSTSGGQAKASIPRPTSSGSTTSASRRSDHRGPPAPSSCRHVEWDGSPGAWSQARRSCRGSAARAWCATTLRMPCADRVRWLRWP